MGGRVCIVVEHCWSNIDEHDNYDEIKAVAGNPTIAENLILGYMRDLIKETHESGGKAMDVTEVGKGFVVVTEYHEPYEGAITYEYNWTIEQFNIVES